MKEQITETYSMIVGLGNDMVGYIVPEYNFQLHPNIPWFDEAEGDHYEETIPWVLKQPLSVRENGEKTIGKKSNSSISSPIEFYGLRFPSSKSSTTQGSVRCYCPSLSIAGRKIDLIIITSTTTNNGFIYGRPDGIGKRIVVNLGEGLVFGEVVGHTSGFMSPFR